MSSRRYLEELKIEAGEQFVELGYRVAKVASLFGIMTPSLYA